MNKIALAIAELHRSERALARTLRAAAARHHSDQDISHLADDLARWSDDHVRALAQHGRHYGLRLSARPRRVWVTRWVQERVSAVLRRRPEPPCYCWPTCAGSIGPPPGCHWTGSCSARVPRPPRTMSCCS